MKSENEEQDWKCFSDLWTRLKSEFKELENFSVVIQVSASLLSTESSVNITSQRPKLQLKANLASRLATCKFCSRISSDSFYFYQEFQLVSSFRKCLDYWNSKANILISSIVHRLVSNIILLLNCNLILNLFDHFPFLKRSSSIHSTLIRLRLFLSFSKN